jgi:hypothetical protein
MEAVGTKRERERKAQVGSLLGFVLFYYIYTPKLLCVVGVSFVWRDSDRFVVCTGNTNVLFFLLCFCLLFFWAS